jgi:predicted metal-dependent enzyme (double-stranded beta helix superfamily)
MSKPTFDVDAFVQDCQDAVSDVDPHGALKSAVERAVEPGPALAALVPERIREVGGLVHYSPDLTVLWMEWPPGMYDSPHDHGCWAVVGVYAGEEASMLYRRSNGGSIEPIKSHSLAEGGVALLGADLIHAVTNPRLTWCGALHVYAGDFLSPVRREWDAETFAQRPWDAGASLARYNAAVAAAGQ